MKKALLKNSLKAITKNKKRFLSLLLMALLGVGFFAGLTASSPDMEDTLDNYLDNTKTYDISILATLGLTDDDIEAIKSIDGIEEAYGICYKDYMAQINEKEYVIQVIEYNENINKPYLIEGRNPENNTECLLDEKMARSNNYVIGDKIQIETEDQSVLQKELEIVGICQSSLYISSERGNTTLGTGKINAYIYVKDLLDSDYYTTIYARVIGAKELEATDEEYTNLINETTDKIEKIRTEREEARYNQLVEEAQKEYEAYLMSGGQPQENTQINIEQNKWYIQTREDNSGYYNILQAIESITNLSRIFPIVFYIIAVLISLTSMTRMIEEERTEIGTLKALGYSNSKIIYKYIIYSTIACILGGVIGMAICFYILPTIIWNTYGLLYKVPDLITPFRVENGLIGLGIAFICIVGATYITCKKELKAMPSSLMRPKAPKAGKKVLLEHIKILWNHISFSKKVTIRNLFRYKKKALMTIIGIAGCTALTLSGFGLRDSITKIVSSQYGDTYKYDGIVYVKSNPEEIIENLKQNDKITYVTRICAQTGEIKKDEKQKSTNIIVPETTEEFEKVCTLYDKNSNEVKLENDGIYITDKMAEHLKINEGDDVTLHLNDGKEYTFNVKKIVKNYIDHYVYMTKETYEKSVGSTNIDLLWIDTVDMSKEEENNFLEEILKDENITSVTILEGLMETINDMLGALDYIVLILIIASAILALTVLYNLANVNISERKREIATLKVLGFYNKEVDSYITRESIIFTIIGIAIGLIAGYFLTQFMIITCEIEDLRFLREILPQSYVYAILITAGFSISVNFIIHFTLKKIDMIESLKSIE